MQTSPLLVAQLLSSFRHKIRLFIYFLNVKCKNVPEHRTSMLFFKKNDSLKALQARL